MEMIITRTCYSRWGVAGTMHIDGQCVAHTCEHPAHCLPPGRYSIRLRQGHMAIGRRRAALRPGNGPMALTDGSIIVGRFELTGLLAHSKAYYAKLYMKAHRCSKKKEPITLIIQNKRQ